MRRVLNWIAVMGWFRRDLARPMIGTRAWSLWVVPWPVPAFGLEELVGFWVLQLGWFEIMWAKPGSAQWMRGAMTR